MELITSQHWTDYELIDTGNREKLERFGPWILARPEPQAVWRKALPESEWERLSHARYERARGKKGAADDIERGTWIRKPKMPDQWLIAYQHGGLNLQFRLGLTAFGHIGVFPEQADNWNFISDALTSRRPPATARVLNLFAYTGGASLAAKSAGADVVHVDSVKQVITWSKEMMVASGLDNIRWVVEDAMNFVRREVKRGNIYDGIILDPPAYGRGPDGEKWVLEDAIDEMMAGCSKLLARENSFLVLSMYSLGLSALVAENLAMNHFGNTGGMQSGEFYFADRAGRKLPLGTFLRFSR